MKVKLILLQILSSLLMPLRPKAERFLVNQDLAQIEGTQLALTVLQLLQISHSTRKAPKPEPRLQHKQEHAPCAPNHMHSTN